MERVTMNTVQLIQLARSGDKFASEELCEKFTPIALQIARYRMGKKIRKKIESMDIVQEAMVAAWMSLKNFTYRNDGDFINWLAKIIENRIRDNIEKYSAKKRDINKEISPDEIGNSRNVWHESVTKCIQTTTPSMIISEHEKYEKLEDAIDRLKDDYKEAISLLRSGLSLREIADAMDRNLGSTKMLLTRAKLKLAEYYKE